jgi:uncharacterized membrane protein
MAVAAFFDYRSFRSDENLSDLDRRLAPIVGTLGFAVWMTQLANIFLFQAFAPYLGALIWLIAFAALAFVRLLLDMVPSRPPESAAQQADEDVE